MPLPGRRGAPADWLIVGLGNPGAEYARTRHNVGFMVAERLIDRWELSKPKRRFKGLLSEGRICTPGVDTPVRAAVLMPQTYMNDAGRSVGPARGALGIDDLAHVLVVHDEIDIPFGEIRVRLGGGLAGHNGLKSIRQGLGSTEFGRVRTGVDRPPTTDPDRVAAYVLSRFSEAKADVEALVDRAADAVERVLREGYPQPPRS
jgi:PTH1 family peptidyl-tRNA hydrolase